MHNFAIQAEIDRILCEYCDAMDRNPADFDAFASIFEHGTWCLLDEPGSEPVRQWLDENIILYDGQAHTKHQLSNLLVDADEVAGTARFTCYVTVWQALDEFPLQVISSVRFTGTFKRLEDGKWWWRTHESAGWVGDTSRHIRGFTGMPKKPSSAHSFD